MSKKMTKTEVLKRVQGLDEQKRNATICALVGHSGIQTGCLGYYYCARCGTQVGDALGGAYDATNVVVVGHNCKTCRNNYEVMGWRDKLFAPDPFAKDAA